MGRDIFEEYILGRTHQDLEDLEKRKTCGGNWGHSWKTKECEDHFEDIEEICGSEK